MPEPVQTTIYGATEALRAPSGPAIAQWASGSWADVAPRLFDAPQTMRGQLAIDTDERSEDLTALNERKEEPRA